MISKNKIDNKSKTCSKMGSSARQKKMMARKEAHIKLICFHLVHKDSPCLEHISSSFPVCLISKKVWHIGLVTVIFTSSPLPWHTSFTQGKEHERHVKMLLMLMTNRVAEQLKALSVCMCVCLCVCVCVCGCLCMCVLRQHGSFLAKTTTLQVEISSTPELRAY